MKRRLQDERQRVGLTDALEAEIFCSNGGPGAQAQMKSLLDGVDANTERLARDQLSTT